ncbi:L,D-transpeptidase family protein [Novosphingobium malaysiense]|uniref:L,D-transpeptidase family protein n=1 Tax=Novosphingobium malaysiense TaxID=1348853 RepID=UPI00068CD647|nr:L,D-transpeptidase family protein [Novosphingobium malaysiense]
MKLRGPLSLVLMVLGLMSCGATDGPEAAAPQSNTAPEGSTVSATPTLAMESWNPGEVESLERWARCAPRDALPSPDISALRTAVASGDQTAIDQAANALALKLARMYLFGIAEPAQRAGWHIKDTDVSIDLVSRLQDAVVSGAIDAFFENLLPSHPDYAELRSAYAEETDPERRETIARNMERWRWMPHSLGESYVLVNTASFEASLWRAGSRVKTWPVIVGKRSTPSPVFSAKITGVILNPWWHIPASIIREKHGNFPARLGYVRTANGFSQKPGPNNALGQMKLVMPNPFSVYMHDTPSKSLFSREVRAFSHGCIRVGNALDYATTLLDGVKSREDVDEIVASRKTTTINLPKPLPVYITYFTATKLGDGTFVIEPDIYGRDKRVPAVLASAETECSGSK